MLKGLPWRLAVVVRQSWSQKEREEEERVIHLLQREQEERFKKERESTTNMGFAPVIL